MNNVEQWKDLRSTDKLSEIKEKSHEKPVVLFKHSTRCSISSMILSRLQGDWDPEEMADVDFYYLDLIAHRDVSNKIAEEFDVVHQSPQIIVIRNGDVVYHDSHNGISYKALKNNLN
ncbi:MAG: bacillithiol system redox-active protein YtxJ [Candidatus Cyclobacteriaceae bacterium M2_1C_046]